MYTFVCSSIIITFSADKRARKQTNTDSRTETKKADKKDKKAGKLDVSYTQRSMTQSFLKSRSISRKFGGYRA